MKKALPLLFLLLACVFFIGAGSAFIHRLGIQNDEVYFATGLYQPLAYRYGITLAGHTVPLMLLSYLGATKTWFYALLLLYEPPTPFWLRFPMLLGGAAVLAMFYLLLRRLGGTRAALIGTALLATDSVFLLVTLWGPIVTHHLLFVGAMLALVGFHQTGSRWRLALAAFLVGFALFDKALFLWVLAGMGVGAMAAFPRAIRKHLSRPNAAVAALALCLGAFPLLLFNWHSRGETLRGNASWTFHEFGIKANAMQCSLNGSLLFGWMVSDTAPPKPGTPRNLVERASLRVSQWTRGLDVGFMPLACVLALALAPLWWRSPARPAILFSTVCFGVAWVQMAITRNAGGGAHHTVLLWPLPHLAVAMALAEAGRRLGKAGAAAALAVTLAVAVPNILILNEYLARAVARGPARDFNDAIFPLATTLFRTPARYTVLTDWGMADSLRLLGEGGLRLRLMTPLASDTVLTGGTRRELLATISLPRAIFVGHTPEMEFFAGGGARLREFAAQNGYEAVDLALIPDSYSRPVFQVFRFEPRKINDPVRGSAGPGQDVPRTRVPES